MSGHHHDHGADAGDKRIWWAILVNVLLTFAQIAGGIVSGSLSLIADAIHNFSDAASLVIAYGARRIARRPADDTMTFGYVRAEIVAALINYTTLIVIGIYLVYEAVMRFITPEPIEGWTVVIIASIALVIDVVTAMLTYALSKTSMNIRAAFLHNVSDALGSVGVIIAGTLVLLYGWTWIDPAITLMIAGYILWQAFTEMGGSIRVLMMATPEGIDVKKVVADLRSVDGVNDVHHVHVWPIDEEHNALEAHLVIKDLSLAEIAGVKRAVRKMLLDRHGIGHCTLEIETVEDGREAAVKVIGHVVDET
ncbi:cation diffusion facilitator family transporter (plasmid) [Agrobacterium rosae]|uniref:Cation diffusion facilitator family transporter n=1 Tax=Agrobacterium rosae TaxID=1972867 RepID=A0ABU4W651_9HYPH|nr:MULTISPECIES: cation diffusion facilitator family transporter [Agrobacterium]MDX8332117.1 cation diffusion facilitator family transporter [Agrobacterium rosae]NTF22682.1 cation transporter [Agrobacterium rubi]NTF29539.1 cation transporter [Agrobacterium rubi]WCJ66070.1 cation diffusion facilitator family transporter [Agrobacterium tumefaciens]